MTFLNNIVLNLGAIIYTTLGLYNELTGLDSASSFEYKNIR